MMGRKGGFLGGMISVFFLSIIIFFILYFFMPDVSEKFFGFSKNQSYTELEAANKAPSAERAAESLEKTDEEAVSEINSFLNGTDDGKKVVEAINAAYAPYKRLGISFDEFKKSDKVMELFDSAKAFIKSGAGKASDFFSDGEGRKMVEGLSE